MGVLSMPVNHKLNCLDCTVKNCINGEEGKFPPFCLSQKIDPELIRESVEEYRKPEINKIAVSAAEVEADNYCKMTRVEETVEFARKIGVRKIGIATCAGLLYESRMAAKIFRSHGFEIEAIACKCGTQKKVDIGVPKRCESAGINICNPVLQAKYLNSRHTDLNVLIGLCVGHDSLFYKYADAPVTTLVAKDRVLGHNPVAALYQADHRYYARLIQEETEDSES